MNVNFTFTDADKSQPVRIEQVFAEKPGGGLVANPAFDVLPTTAVGKNSSGAYAPIKAYRLAEDVASGDSTIKVEKGSARARIHVREGDFFFFWRLRLWVFREERKRSRAKRKDPALV